MADEEQLRLLQQGVDAWNAWRQQVGEGTHINLHEADLRRAKLADANLLGADLSGAKLIGAKLSGSALQKANLQAADLSGGADLRQANFSEADLSGASLHGANLNAANLKGANLDEADLSEADLSEADLLVLSEASIASEWVEDEVTKAFAEERQRGGVVLFPVRLDDAVFTTKEAWARKLRDNRNIGDFHAWKNHDTYQCTLERLLRDLQIENAPAASAEHL